LRDRLGTLRGWPRRERRLQDSDGASRSPPQRESQQSDHDRVTDRL